MRPFRAATFAGVGLIGFVVQLVTLALLVLAGWPYLVATCVAVEAAVLHNFAWHERWTWADRALGHQHVAARLIRFNLTTGVASIAGNVLLVALFVEIFGVSAIVANVLAVAALTVVNFLIADRWVFAALAFAAASVICTPSPAAAAEPSCETIAAWDSFVKITEARIQYEARDPRARSSREVTGETISIAGGLIHHWSGSVFVKGVTLDTMIDRLLTPGTPPPQEDVLESRVLNRFGDASLRVYLKVTRRTIVSATYDTEHDVTFTRLSPNLAVSRSISRRIVEVGGSDRGFMWRLNSYWRYQQVPGGVIVEMESLTLSRTVPAVLRPVALPIVSRVARESVTRTLDAFRSWFESTPRPAL